MARSRLVLVALLVVLPLAGCGSGAPPPAAATPAPPVPTVDPYAAPYQEFVNHVAPQAGKLATLSAALAKYAGAGNVTSAGKEATAIRTWATAEAKWLDAHPTRPCYAAAYILWDDTRAAAAKTATDLLAGRYEAAASDLDAMAAASTRATNAVLASSC